WPKAQPASPSARLSAGKRPGSPNAAPAVALSPEQVPTFAPVDPGAVGASSPRRDIFRFPPPTPTRTPTPAPPTPTPIPMPGQKGFVGPMPIPPTPTFTPIVPPAIPYKLVGLF